MTGHGEMPKSLLRTKLHVPPLGLGLVPRPRLIQRLERRLRTGSRMTLISAPAGFGKTTLLTYCVPRDSIERRSCEECNSGSYEPEI